LFYICWWFSFQTSILSMCHTSIWFSVKMKVWHTTPKFSAILVHTNVFLLMLLGIISSSKTTIILSNVNKKWKCILSQSVLFKLNGVTKESVFFIKPTLMLLCLYRWGWPPFLTCSINGSRVMQKTCYFVQWAEEAIWCTILEKGVLLLYYDIKIITLSNSL